MNDDDDEQMPLDFTRPVRVIARSTDPETSHEAAAALEHCQTRLQRSVQTVVAILKSRGEPMSDFEIGDCWPLWWGGDLFSESLPRKARHWARQAGLVRRAGYGEHQKRKVLLWDVGRDEDFLAERTVCECCGRPMTPKDDD